MHRSYPRLIERYPAYRDVALKQRFQDKVLDELCRDYERVARALETQKTELAMNSTTSNKRQELMSLARKLEHEYLERLASHAEGEQKRSHK
jgi:hypothetical protein